PSWLDKLIGEVVRRLLEAYYEPQFPARSHGFRPGRCCHTALDEIGSAWTGATWFTEGDIADCLGSPPTTRSCLRSWTNASMPDGSCGGWATCCGRGIWRTGCGTPPIPAHRRDRWFHRSCPISTSTGSIPSWNSDCFRPGLTGTSVATIRSTPALL